MDLSPVDHWQRPQGWRCWPGWCNYRAAKRSRCHPALPLGGVSLSGLWPAVTHWLLASTIKVTPPRLGWSEDRAKGNAPFHPSTLAGLPCELGRALWQAVDSAGVLRGRIWRASTELLGETPQFTQQLWFLWAFLCLFHVWVFPWRNWIAVLYRARTVLYRVIGMYVLLEKS